MKLIVHELEAAGVSQVLTPAKNIIVEAVRPHLYRHLNPSGNLKVEIYDGVTLVATSEEIDISDIASGSNYFHGYVRFYINAYLEADTAYTFKLVGGDGYTFDNAAYIGWCNDFDLIKYETETPETVALNRPLDIEIWERRVR
jgi:hypothetical protein